MVRVASKTARRRELPRNPSTAVAEAAQTEGLRRHALSVLALCALVLLAYSNSFRSGFVFDNAWAILEDSRVHAATAGNVELILTRSYAFQNSIFRPLTTISFLANYAVLGNGTQPAGYHWTNLAIHAANAALAYWLGLLMFQAVGANRQIAAFALAAVWAVHPILTESVTNIVCRADLLAEFGVSSGTLNSHVAPASFTGRKRWWLTAPTVASTIPS